MESEVPGIQLHKREGAEGAYCSCRLSGPMQGAAPVTESAGTNGGTGGDWSRELSAYLKGWQSYYGYCQSPIGAQIPGLVDTCDACVASSGRNGIRGRPRLRDLRAQGVTKELAAQTAGITHGPWRISRQPGPTCYAASLCLLRRDRSLPRLIS